MPLTMMVLRMAEGNESDFIIEDGMIAMFDVLQGPQEAAEESFIEAAFEVLQYAKDNAPWQDQTGNARNGLEVEVYSSGTDVIMDLYHTVDYGLWLEVIQNGEYATIMPTLEQFAPTVFSKVGGVITGEGGGSDG